MDTIDSYTEKISTMDSGTGTISMLPGGLSREEYLNHLDILITEMYSTMTSFQEYEFRTGYALLQLIRKYCLSKKVFDNLQQEKDFSDYLAVTNKMIDDELSKFTSYPETYVAVIDSDKVFTIIANIMQLLTSVIQAKRKEKEKASAQVFGINLPFMMEKQNSVGLARENTSIVDIIPFLDDLYSITESFEKAIISPVGSKTALMEWVEFKYLKSVLELTKCKLDEIGVFD